VRRAPKPTWVQLTVDVPADLASEAEALLHACGVAGMEVRDADTLPMPQVRAARAGMAILIASFPSRSEGRAAQQVLRENVPRSRTVLRSVRERDWSTAWRGTIRARVVGRLWVGPPWLRRSAPAGKVAVVIEPGMAFGTGDHATTALCLRGLDAGLREFPGASVLDVGTGTGVLAIAARRLGASRTVATDIDPVAVRIARETARSNRVDGIDFGTRPVGAVAGRFDLVVANILASTLIELAPRLARRTRRRLMVSGILVDQVDAVARAFEREGLVRAGVAREREWARLDLCWPEGEPR
jgi:ribosomal protein L11 methyltransferase